MIITHEGLNALLKAAKEKQFDVVIIREWSRFTRSYSKLMNIFNELQNARVSIECVLEPHELTFEHIQFIKDIINMSAKVEKKRIVSRMKAGKQARRRQREQGE